MTRYCVICGNPFQASPSDKKVTCYPECRSKRASIASTGRRYRLSDKARSHRTEVCNRPEVKARLMESAKKASDAAMENPLSQRGPQNRTSLFYILIDPTGHKIPVVGLEDWCRNHCELFSEVSDRDKDGARIAKGFRAIASYLRGVPSRTQAVTSYKGWGLSGLPWKVPPICSTREALDILERCLNGEDVSGIQSAQSILAAAGFITAPEGAADHGHQD